MRKVYLIAASVLLAGLVLTMPFYTPPQPEPQSVEIGEPYRQRLRSGEYEELEQQFGHRLARQIDSLRFRSQIRRDESVGE